MLDRKIYQLYNDGQEVWIFLRDQQRWLEQVRITDVEGELVALRYETEEEDEVCSWEEVVRLDSIGAITRKLSSIPIGDSELMISEDCPDAEKLPNPHPDSNPD